MSAIDETHDPRRESWVASAKGHTEFPIQNLPLGVFSPSSGAPRGGVAIGDMIFDLQAGVEAGLFFGETARAAEAGAGATLNPLMALGSAPRIALRKRLRDVPRYRERVAGAARREQPLSGALVPFSPQFFKQDQLKTDAVIAFAAKIGDWPLVEDAADAKIADQIEFVRWWDENVRRNQGAPTDLNADLFKLFQGRGRACHRHYATASIALAQAFA